MFETAEIKCATKVLELLSRGKSKYKLMKKEAGISHTTLQRVIKYLIKKKFIKRKDIGHMKVDYEITKKGKELLRVLEQVKKVR